MLKNTELTNIVELYDELTAYRQVFPNVVLMVQGTNTTAVTSVTCERSFSKMKTIKITLRILWTMYV